MTACAGIYKISLDLFCCVSAGFPQFSVNDESKENYKNKKSAGQGAILSLCAAKKTWYIDCYVSLFIFSYLL